MSRMSRGVVWKKGLCAGVLLLGAFFVVGGNERAGAVSYAGADSIPTATPIKHLVMIQQENRSFDNYFGVYPGATGIPFVGGVPSVACNPDPVTGTCVLPWADHADVNRGGPHSAPDSYYDIAGGAFTGFQARAATGAKCKNFTDPNCAAPGSANDAMGYHTGTDIPNYWAYAKNFVLQDHFFAATKSWSLPAHLQDVSGWSARCKTASPMSCQSDLYPLDARGNFKPKNVSWTDVTYLLHKAGVSWGYYVARGGQPDCADDSAVVCNVGKQSKATPGIWNPLPAFADVRDDGELANIQDTGDFVRAATTGNLPSVSWVIPNQSESEHAPSKISTGQAYVTTLVNAIMNGADWNSTAIVISWDDWGGFYDGVMPPQVDGNGYGMRVPGLVISPYAKEGYIDHQVLSGDAYLKFMEDNWLSGQRIDSGDGRPDSRPSVRENASQLGTLMDDFNFDQVPRMGLVLNPYPSTTLTPTPVVPKRR